MGTVAVVGALHICAAVPRLGRDAGIDEAAPIIPGPAEEIALVDVGQIVGDEVGAEHVALVDHGPELVAARIISEADRIAQARGERSEEHTSELQSLMRISYAVFCLKKTKH